jgi:hypothetical protein
MWPRSMSEQQHLDVGAVHIRITEDADLAVAQPRQVNLVTRRVRIDTDGHRDVVDLVVGEEAVLLHLPGVEHLATQRQDGLRLLVAAHLGAAACGIALDEEDLVEAHIPAFAVGELTRQHGHARALALFDLLAGALACLRLADHQLGELAAHVDMLVEP